MTCPDGYRLLSSDTFATAGTCVACAPGTASRDGLRCTPCNVGWNASASGSRWCNQCPAGSISVTAASPTGTNVTMSGLTYIYGLNAGTVCYQCPAGYYQPVPGGHVCLPCSPGEQQQQLDRPLITLRPWIASHACMVHACCCHSRHPHRLTLHPRASLRTNSLSTGTYSLAAGSTNCTRCAAGTASADAALSTACPSCPANTYAQYVGSTVCL